MVLVIVKNKHFQKSIFYIHTFRAMLFFRLILLSIRLLKIIETQSFRSYCPVGIIGESAYSIACEAQDIYCKV
jgi:hypothetical protein